MTKGRLNELKEHLLRQHPYFNSAFSDVVKSTKGIVHTNEYGKREEIFPADNLGDYFYLRMDTSGNISYEPRFTLSTATVGIGAVSSVFLVACVKDADPDILLENLINSIRTFQPDNIRLTRFLIQPEYVILQELQGVGEEATNEALKRLRPDFTIVSVSLSLSFPIQFKKHTCYEKPCRQC